MSGALKTQANALRLICRAEQIIEAFDEPSLRKALRLALGSRLPLTVLGNGTNVVLGSEIEGAVVLIRSRGRSLQRDGYDCLLTAAAGENWHDLVRFSLAQGIFGLENLALIPGLVGAAPIQNIGAYGVELSEVFESLEAIHRDTGERKHFDRDACEFGYRTSVFKRGAANPWIIWRVTLRLSSQPLLRMEYRDVREELGRLGIDKPSPVDIAEAVVRVRRRKLPDPRFMPNVGSFFKNPLVSEEEADRLRRHISDLVVWPMEQGNTYKLSAAQLIDRAGLKGLRMNGARVWFRQPLVLVNESAPERALFMTLAHHLRTVVAERWGIKLEYEPDFYPVLCLPHRGGDSACESESR